MIRSDAFRAIVAVMLPLLIFVAAATVWQLPTTVRIACALAYLLVSSAWLLPLFHMAAKRTFIVMLCMNILIAGYVTQIGYWFDEHLIASIAESVTALGTTQKDSVRIVVGVHHATVEHQRRMAHAPFYCLLCLDILWPLFLLKSAKERVALHAAAGSG